jgi:hypothetical protein
MNKKSIIISASLLVAVILLFTLKTKKTSIPSTEDISANNSSVQGEFLGTLISLNTLELDTKIIQTDLFKSLVPSPALVNLDPEKGRIDPFMATGFVTSLNNKNTNIDNTPVRDVNLGEISDKNITISRITTSTVFVTITGFGPNEAVTLVLTDTNGKQTNYREFTFKSNTQELSRALTGLIPSMEYTASLLSVNNEEITKTTFITK